MRIYSVKGKGTVLPTMTISSARPEAADEISAHEADALVQAGLAASRAGDAQHALHLFARASAANPAGAVPHFLIGSEDAALGEVGRAEAALANAVLLAPAMHIARYQLGLLQFSSGRAALALVSWGPLFELDETNPLIHFVRGFAALAQDDFTAAEASLQAGLALNRGNEALSADVQKILLGIQHAKVSGNPAPAAGEQPASHVLVSNYGKFGTLH
jgi:tetratricopeptide (TPR) repeat protein